MKQSDWQMLIQKKMIAHKFAGKAIARAVNQGPILVLNWGK